MSQLNRTFYQLSQTSSLWQKLTLDITPTIIDAPGINWKALYRQEAQAEKNLLVMRKRTFSLIASTIPPLNRHLSRGRALTMVPGDYYFSFNAAGDLRAIFQSRCVTEVFDVDGKVKKMRTEDWNVKGAVHNQFVQVAILDGHYLFTPHIELESISPLNLAQRAAVNVLNQKIRNWLLETVNAPDLDEQVAQALRGHYKHLGAIECMRGAEDDLTSEHKAYLVFFRALTENPSALTTSDSLAS